MSDCDIKQIVSMFNRHLAGQGYITLDWRTVKAMIWTETGGPDNRAWKKNPMQIGKQDDPGLRALLFGNEGGELIMPTALRQRLTVAAVLSTPKSNIEAGTAYLLMRHARYEIKTVHDRTDKKIYAAKVGPGDSLDKFARTHGTTVDVLKSSNVTTAMLRPGQELKYQKASLRKVIAGWQMITSTSIARRYNVGDARYSQKLNYCLEVMKRNRIAEGRCES